jgi:hypothetical protein
MTIVLEKGKHDSPEEGMCLMEAVAFIAGEEFTDRPECVSPVLAEFGRTLNDFLSDDARQQLIPLIPKLIGTVDPEQDQWDGLRCAHWIIAHWLPTWLDLVPDLKSHATALRAIPAPKTWVDVEDWFAVIDAAEAAAEGATEGAAEAAAEGATQEAAWKAAYVSAYAAWEAAREAAWEASWETSRSDASDAVTLIRVTCGRVITWTYADNVGTLLPTVIQLEQDSIDLFIELVEGRHK